MVWFNYNYTSSSDIINNIKLLTEYSNFEYVFLIISIIVLILCILYIFPYINIYYTFIKEEKIKEKRRTMIKQIAMQKNINDEIEKELNI